MAGLEEEMARAKARGDEKINGFTGAVRSLENLGLEEGDTFTIPTEFDVFKQKIGNGEAQYIFITLANGNVKPFYPSVFTKSRPVFTEKGEKTDVRKYTTGTAADLFRTKGSVADGMNLLKGKTLKVTKVEEVHTLRYGTSDQFMEAQIPVIDIVE